MADDCPDPENSPDPIGVPVNPGGGLTPEREGWAPDRLGIPGMGGPARAGPISTSMRVSPCTAAE